MANMHADLAASQAATSLRAEATYEKYATIEAVLFGDDMTLLATATGDRLTRDQLDDLINRLNRMR